MPNAKMDDTSKLNFIERRLAAGLDISLKRDEFSRQVWFPWGSLGQGYFVERDVIFGELRVFLTLFSRFLLGLSLILTVFVMVNGVTLNLTNAMLLLALTGLLFVFGHAYILSIIARLNLRPSPMRLGWKDDVATAKRLLAAHALTFGLGYRSFPTWMLWSCLGFAAFFSLGFFWSVLIETKFEWEQFILGLFFTSQILLIGVTLYRRKRNGT